MKKVAIIGLGLIGSSLCRALKKTGLYSIVGFDKNSDYRNQSREFGFCHNIYNDLNATVEGADIIVLATPVSTYASIVFAMDGSLKMGAIITDVGSVKQFVIDAVIPVLPTGCEFIAGHPIAGTEKSGPSAGFDSLFINRFVILCPLESNTNASINTVKEMWKLSGSKVDIMDALHHDKVLAITSHIPHLLGYTLVGTAQGLQDNATDISKKEVIKYSAGGFRDATRVAGSDPTMWRDIFLTNKPALNEIITLFENDLNRLKQAMAEDDGQFLFDWFVKTREIRQGVIDAGQDKQEYQEDSITRIVPYSTN